MWQWQSLHKLDLAIHGVQSFDGLRHRTRYGAGVSVRALRRQPDLREIAGQTAVSKGGGGMKFRRTTAATMLAGLFLFYGCSAQPVSTRTELEMAGAAALIGAGAGAFFGSQHPEYSMAQTVAIGTFGFAGVVLLYEEIKRQANYYGPYQSIGSEEEPSGGASASGSSSNAGGSTNSGGTGNGPTNGSAAGLKLN